MTAQDFYNLKIKKAKEFGFPEPIYINTEKLTDRTLVVYLVEIQSILIPDQKQHSTHHFALRFSKFRKQGEVDHWEEVDLTTETGFTIHDRSSLEKLAAYIKANEALLNIDILSKDYTSAILTNDEASLSIIERVLQSGKNKDAIYQLFKDRYPELDKKILTYKLVQSRKLALVEFKASLDDVNKKERDYWQPFLEKNRWMFGLSYFLLLDESRIDIWDTADYLFNSEDGFVDIVEIKHPHVDFWEKDSSGNHKKYRDFIQHSEDLKGAVTQATNYIFQVEKKFSDPDWCRKNHCETPVKPKCTVIFDRSLNWFIDEKTAFRLLNDSLHGIEVITFDHLYSRAERVLSSLENET